jgi:hypothetical protein
MKVFDKAALKKRKEFVKTAGSRMPKMITALDKVRGERCWQCERWLCARAHARLHRCRVCPWVPLPVCLAASGAQRAGDHEEGDAPFCGALLRDHRGQ